MDIKPIHRIFASLIIEKEGWTIDRVPEADREAVEYVLNERLK